MQGIVHPLAPLGYVAQVLPSGVDKKSVEDETPVRLCNYTDVYHRDRITVDIEFMEATATEAEIARFTLRPGDVVITKDSETADDIAIPALVVEDLGGVVLGYHNALLRPDTTKVEPRFLFWALMGRHSASFFETKARGVTRVGLRADDIAALPVPLPSLEVQGRVADTLDAETDRIDTLIAKNKDLVGLNSMRRRILVEEATKPRDGVRRVPVRFVLREVDERVGTADTELPLLSVSISSGVGRRSTDSKGQVASDDLSNYKVCRFGDVVLNRMRAFQGGLGVADEDGVVSSDYAVLRPQWGLPRYFHHVMRAPWFVGEMTRRLRGIGDPTLSNVRTPRINVADLGRIEIPLPELSEQQDIVAMLDHEFRIQEKLVDAVRRQTAALKKKRQALITAAVTGQIAV